MRVLLDACLPRHLVRDLPGHDATTVPREGWAGTKNGALLRLAAAAGFDALVTVDKGIEYQQRVTALPFAVVALRAPSNDLDDLRVPPGNRPEKLRGDRDGQHSIRVNDPWRVCSGA